MISTLEELRGRGVLSPLDDRFARSMMRLASDECPEVLLAAALASRQVARGDVCVDLASLVEASDFAEDGEAVTWPPGAPGGAVLVRAPGSTGGHRIHRHCSRDTSCDDDYRQCRMKELHLPFKCS